MLEQLAFEKEKASKVDEIADVKTDRQQLAFEKEKASKVDAARSALADRSRLWFKDDAAENMVFRHWIQGNFSGVAEEKKLLGFAEKKFNLFFFFLN